MARVSDFVEPSNRTKLLRADDVEREDLVILDVEIRDGQFGEYAIITAKRPSGEEVNIVNGGILVIRALRRVLEAKALPVHGKFVRMGRAWTIE